MSFAWYDPDRGRLMLQSFLAAANDVIDYLHVPSCTQVWIAGQAAAQDSSRAALSACHLLFLVAQPILRLMSWILFWVGWVIYKYILVEGIYNSGLSQAKEAAVIVWNWQKSLTREQLLLEAAILVSLVGLYQLHKFLERRKYVQKVSVWVNYRRQQLNKIYHKGVRRIARFSLVLAAMTSHVLFFASAAALKLSLPRLVSKTANPKFISLFSFYAPLFFTVTALVQYKHEMDEGERKKTPKSAKTSRKTGKDVLSPKQKSPTARKRRMSGESGNSSMIPTTEESLEDELQDWLRFWMVRAAVEASKSLLAWGTPQWLFSSLLQVELLFFLWVFCMPLIQPGSIAGEPLPEGRPLRVMCSYLGPYSRSLVDCVSGAVPLELWRNQVVGLSSRILSALVLVRVLKQPTSEWLLHLVEEGRGLIIPALTLMTPGFLTKYGVVYVQYVLSLSKSYRDEQDMGVTMLWLQYWVIHAIADAVLFHFAPILWWIPFSTHVTFCLWCYLLLPPTIEHWYHVVESEFKLFGLLPGQHDGEVEQTRTAKLLLWIWELLPKAKDAEDTGSDASTPYPVGKSQGPNKQADVGEPNCPIVAASGRGVNSPAKKQQIEVSKVPCDSSNDGSLHEDIVHVGTSITTEDVDPADEDESSGAVSMEEFQNDSDEGSESAFVNLNVRDHPKQLQVSPVMTRASRRRAEQEAHQQTTFEQN